MKTTLVMAISVNGFVTGPNDDTEWVKDFDTFHKTVADFGIAVMGKRTYDECVKYGVFPYKGALNIVMTHDPELLKKKQEQALFTDASAKDVQGLAREKGFENVLVIGGGHLNGSFLKEGLIDEIILDIHPIIIPGGIRLFEAEFANTGLTLLEHKQINDGILQVRYAVKKPE